MKRLGILLTIIFLASCNSSPPISGVPTSPNIPDEEAVLTDTDIDNATLSVAESVDTVVLQETLPRIPLK
jgi:hypothetical protein